MTSAIVALLWSMSYGKTWSVSYTTRHEGFRFAQRQAQVWRGRVRFDLAAGESHRPLESPGLTFDSARAGAAGQAWPNGRLGFHGGSSSRDVPFYTENRQVLIVPLWLPFGLSLVVPGVWLFWRSRRTRPGCCLVCGYDLRASTERCSECGTPIPKDAKPIKLRQ